MLALVAQLNVVSALGALISQVAAVVLIALLIQRRISGATSPILSLVGSYGIHLVFLISIAGTALSLTYSEVFGFVPCGLCWLQRIFLYPMVILSGLALWKRDRSIADYLIALSIPGMIVALYQHYLQLGGSNLVGCPAAGFGADCAKRILFEFGYITFPLVAFSAFVLIATVAYTIRSQKSL